LKVVSNSSTLIALARINHLDILEKVVKKLIIPPAVYDDIVIKGAGRPGSAEIRQAKWIEKRNVSDQEMVMRLNSILGLGESEAIALAKEIKADLIILDDDKARKVALSEGLRISGLLAFLVQAKEKGIIERVKPLMDGLKLKGFFISENLYQDTIQKAGE
jgi:predicted nucleic acid-binding protein